MRADQLYVVSEPKTIDAEAAVTTLIHTHKFTIHKQTQVADGKKNIAKKKMKKKRGLKGLKTSHLCSKSSPYQIENVYTHT